MAKTTIQDTYTRPEYTDGKTADGLYVGQTGGKIGFLGATPVVRQAALTAVSTTTTTATQWVTTINAIITLLETFGLVDAN